MRIALLSGDSPADRSATRSAREGGPGEQSASNVAGTDDLRVISEHARMLRALGHEVLVLHGSTRAADDSSVVAFDGDALTRELGLAERPERDRVTRELDRFGAEVCELRSTGHELAWAAHFDLPIVARQVTSLLAPIARAGCRGLGGVSFATHAQQRALEEEFDTVPNRWVVHDGIETEGLPELEEPAEPDPDTEAVDEVLSIRCFGTVDDRVAVFAELAEHFPGLRFEFDDPDAARQTGVDPGRVSGVGDAPAAITVCFASATEPSAERILEAMRDGSTLVVEERPALREFVRTEVDGLGFADANGLQRALDRLVRFPKMRHRLASTARSRLEERFSLSGQTAQRIELYELAIGRRGASAPATGSDEAVAFRIDGSNWFDAWWVRQSEPVPTKMRRDDDGRIVLAAGPLLDVQAVHALLVRTWSTGPADWSAPEWNDCRELQEAITDRLSAARGEKAETDEHPIAYPALDHPLLRADRDSPLLDEVWRLRDSTNFGDWLRSSVANRRFAAEAADNINLRRLIVELARRAPDQEIFDILRRIYRDPKRRSRVVAEDLDFCDRSPQAGGFREEIDVLGLHAELPQARFTKARSRSVPEGGVEPRITVLIPSYRHAGYIERTVESCLRQSLGDLLVLVADDRSPDDTVEVARSIDDPRLEVRVNEQNLGLGASVEHALESVTTPFVALLNSDDLFHPDRLERCLERFDRDPGLALVATRFDVVDKDDRLLSLDNACSVEVGPAARSWLRWFEGLASELETEEGWTDFRSLLRHNVLATSSNMVFRTDWLRERIRSAKDLRYCLDWSLFLHASLEERLGFVDEALMAYRLHDANTVWFQEGDRPDYVVEVNRVLDEALQIWLRRRIDQAGETTAIAELADLLEGAVSGHGETDGLALYLAGSARRQDADRIDATGPEIVRLATQALRRKAFSQATAGLDVDPWSLGWRVKASEKYADEHALVERLTTRSQELDRQFRDVRHRLESERQTRADRERELSHFRFERDLFEKELEKARSRISELEDTRRRLRGELDERTVQANQLRSDLDRLQGRFDELQKRFEELDRRHLATSRSLAETAAALERAEQQAEENRALAEFRGSMFERAVAELAAPSPDLLRRGGRLDRLRAGVWRRAWEVGRLVDRTGRHRRRLMILGGQAPGECVEPEFRSEGAHELRLTFGDLFRRTDRRLELADDHAVAMRDREYFAGRVPEAVQVCDVIAGLDSLAIDRAYRTARVAKSRGVGRLVVYGLGREALAALVARRTVGCAYALILGDDDLSASQWSTETMREILSGASWIAVDSEILRAAIHLRCPGQKSISVCVPGPRFVPNTKRSPRSGAIPRVLALWDGMHRADPETLLAAVQILRERKRPIALDVLVNGGRTRRAVSSRLLLHQLIDEQQLSDCVRILDGEDDSSRVEVWANASLGLWVARDLPRCGLPRMVVEATWAGLPIIATSAGVFETEWKWLPAATVPARKRNAVASAIASHLDDREPVEREARARRERFLAEWRQMDRSFWRELRNWSPAGAEGAGAQ